MGITVLSLFDGISCGMVALERAGIEVDKYIAYEIEHNAIEISKKNYPEIVRGGDVTKEDFTKYKGKIDILIGGSPCQNLCSCGNRKGLEGEESRLFFDYVRALYETEAKWFLLENNATMTKENQDIITGIMGVEPIYIKVLEIIYNLYKENKPVLPNSIVSNFETVEEQNNVSKIFVLETNFSIEESEKALNDQIKKVKEAYYNKLISESMDSPDILEMIKEKRNISKLYISLSDG